MNLWRLDKAGESFTKPASEGERELNQVGAIVFG